MTWKDLRAWEDLLATTTWMPNAALGIGEPYPGVFELRVRLEVPDTYDPDTVARVGHRYPLPDHVVAAGHEAMVVYLRKCLRAVAIHEADEWLVVAGERPFDPHRVTT